MAWIESHQSLAKHKKLLRLSGLLKVNRVYLVGHLHYLWWWGLDNADIDGRLGDVTAFEIAEAAEWDGDPDEFVTALVEAGFLKLVNGEYVLHDWYDYAGKLNERREKERERSRQRRSNNQRTTAQRPIDDRATTAGQPPVDQQTTVGTQPNLTIPKEDDDDTRARAREGELWREFEQVFAQAFGGSPTALHFEEVDGFIADGMTLESVVEAVRIAALNKARGWSYVRRTLQNWLKDGQTSLDAIREKQKRIAPSRASPQPEPLSWIDRELAKVEAEIRELEQRKAAGGEA